MNQLVHFENAKRELQLATNVDEVKDLRDKAEALRLYMKQAGESLRMQNQCAEIKVRAERRAGELLKATVKPGNPQLSHDVTIKTLPIIAIEEEVGLRKYNLAEQDGGAQ